METPRIKRIERGKFEKKTNPKASSGRKEEAVVSAAAICRAVYLLGCFILTCVDEWRPSSPRPSNRASISRVSCTRKPALRWPLPSYRSRGKKKSLSPFCPFRFPLETWIALARARAQQSINLLPSRKLLSGSAALRSFKRDCA